MALVQKINGVTITNRVRLTGGTRDGVVGWPSTAWYGEPGIAGIEFDDPLGELEITPWSTYTADETADTTKPRIFTGWIGSVRISRGPYRTGAGRVLICDIVDQNAIFSLEVLRSSAASVRPAETDVARITALIASHAMAATPIADNGRFNTSNPLNFGAANYVTQYPQAVLESLGTSGKNFYAYWDDTADEISLHYDVTTANPLSDLAISNVIADQDATTFYPMIDAELHVDPSRQYSGVLLGYLGGYVYARDEDLFGPSDFSPVNFLRDDVYTTDRIGLLTTANAQVQAQLANRAEPTETVTVTVRVPAAVVNEAHAGDAISLKATHLPGYEDGVAMAIIRRNVVPAPQRRDYYDVTMELSNNTTTVLPPGGGDPGEVPQVDPCDVDAVDLVQEKYMYPSETGAGPWTYTGAWDTSPAQGHLLVCSFFMSNGNLPISIDVDGYNFQGEAMVPSGDGQKYGAVFTKIAEAGEPTSVALVINGTGFGGLASSSSIRLQLQEWAGVDTVDTVAIEEDITSAQGEVVATITPTADLSFAMLVAASGIDGALSNQGFFPASVGGVIDNEVRPSTHQTWNALHRLVEDTTGSYQIGTSRNTGANGIVVALALTCSGGGGGDPDAPCIAAGQPNFRPEVVTMVGDDGTTACPFADGSLHVYFDNVEQTAELTAQDGAAGTFTTGTTPTPTEVVTVEYLGRVGA